MVEHAAQAMNSDVAAQIAEALEPLVGPVLARVTVDVEARRLEKEPRELTYDDVPRISVALERNLSSFVGNAVAEAAATRVRAITPI